MAFCALAVASVRDKSAAYDEVFHITGGYSYWITNDYRLHPTNGNLIQRWEALPLLLSGLRFPSLDQQAWQHPGYHGVGMAMDFFYTAGNDFTAMLQQARAMVVVLAAGLGWAIYSWSRHLFGRRGALISLILYCSCPTILAHGQLATSDMAAALFFTLAVRGIWRCLQRISLSVVLASALATGGLFLTKFSAPLLIPMALLMVIVRLTRQRSLPIAFRGRLSAIRGRFKQGLVFLLLAGVHAAVTMAMIWICYGLRYSAFAPGDPGNFSEPWSVVLDRSKYSTTLIERARSGQILPEAFLYGLAHTLKFSEQRAAFINGECGLTGWWYYFPYCLAVKTPLPVFAILGVALLGAFRWRRLDRQKPGGSRVCRTSWHKLYRTAPLWILLGVYWFVAIRSHINLGVRHILPTYPPLFILAGAAGWTLRPLRKAGLLVVALLGVQVAECLLVYPNYLAYFNQLVGGSRNGYKHLVDSNLDWGQDLPGLARWLDHKGLNNQDKVPVYLSYQGTGSPKYYGIHVIERLELYLRDKVSVSELFPLRGGVYCISATTVEGPNEPIPRWTSSAEAKYRQLLQLLQTQRPGHATLPPAELKQLTKALGSWEFERLLAYLRQREPDESINYSILIYRLTDSDVRHALTEPILEEE